MQGLSLVVYLLALVAVVAVLAWLSFEYFIFGLVIAFAVLLFGFAFAYFSRTSRERRFVLPWTRLRGL